MHKRTDNNYQFKLTNELETNVLDISDEGKLYIDQMDTLTESMQILTNDTLSYGNPYKIRFANTMELDRQISFNYGFKDYFIGVVASGSGAYNVNNGRAQLVVNGLGVTIGFGVWPTYRGPGKATDLRFTAAMDTSPGVISYMGLGGVHNGVQLFNDPVGDTYLNVYYGGRPHIVVLTITTAAASAQSVTITLNGVVYGPIAVTNASGSTSFSAYELGLATFTPFLVDVSQNTLTFIHAQDGPQTGTYSISSTGSLTGTFTTKVTGVARTNEFIPQSNWVSGQSVDITQPTEYIIRHWCSGIICYEVYMVINCEMMLMHMGAIQPPTIPHMIFDAGIINVADGLTYEMSIYTVSIWSETGPDLSGPATFADLAGISYPASTTVPLLLVKNRFEMNGYRNYTIAEAATASFTVESTKPCELTLAIPLLSGSAVPGDYPRFFEAIAPSPTLGLIATRPTLQSGSFIPQTAQFKYFLPKDGQKELDFRPFNVILVPGQTLGFYIRGDSIGTITINFTALTNY